MKLFDVFSGEMNPSRSPVVYALNTVTVDFNYSVIGSKCPFTTFRFWLQARGNIPRSLAESCDRADRQQGSVLETRRDAVRVQVPFR